MHWFVKWCVLFISVGLDYIAVNKILDFAPGVTLNTISIQILDDLGRPHLEGVEHFQIVLKSTIGGLLGSPDKAMVYINDSVSDGRGYPHIYIYFTPVIYCKPIEYIGGDEVPLYLLSHVFSF